MKCKEKTLREEDLSKENEIESLNKLNGCLEERPMIKI